MARHADSDEVIAILRALAVLHERRVGDLRVAESSRRRPLPGSHRAHLDVEFDRDEFWRVVGGLRQIGAIPTERLFQRHMGPGEREAVAQDSALELLQTLERCANAGYEVRISGQDLGVRPSGVPGEEHELVWTVTVPAHAFYALRPHQF